MGLQELNMSEKRQTQDFKVIEKKYQESSAVFPELCLFILLYIKNWLTDYPPLDNLS